MQLMLSEEKEEHRIIRESLSSTISRFDNLYWREHDRKAQFPQEYFDALASNNWFGLNVPEAYGGAGLGLTEVSIAIHEAARICGVAAADIIMANCTFGVETYKRFANEEIKARLLKEFVSGRHIVSFAITEPGAGVNTLDISTKARREGDGYIINGQKIWITLAHKATLMNVLARTKPKDIVKKRTEGLTIFLVEIDKIKRGSIRIKRIDDISMRALGSNEVFFDELFVPETNIIGEVDRAWDILPTILNAERISTASMSIGLGELLIKMACDYAKQRIVFSRPIGSNQAIQLPLARAFAQLNAAWAVTEVAARKYDNGEDCSIPANVAAYLGAEAASLASDRAMQTFGGMAYSSDSDVERHWRDGRLFRTGPLPEEMALSFIAQRLLNLPRSY